MLPGFQIEEPQKSGRLGFDKGFVETAQPADKLQILEAGEIGVEVRLFRHVSDRAAKGDHVVANVAAFEEHVAVVGPQHAGDHFDGGGFAGAIGAEKADDFAGGDCEADVLNGGDAAIASEEMVQLQHGGYGNQFTLTLCSIQYNGIVK